MMRRNGIIRNNGRGERVLRHPFDSLHASEAFRMAPPAPSVISLERPLDPAFSIPFPSIRSMAALVKIDDLNLTRPAFAHMVLIIISIGRREPFPDWQRNPYFCRAIEGGETAAEK